MHGYLLFKNGPWLRYFPLQNGVWESIKKTVKFSTITGNLETQKFLAQ